MKRFFTLLFLKLIKKVCDDPNIPNIRWDDKGILSDNIEENFHFTEEEMKKIEEMSKDIHFD